MGKKKGKKSGGQLQEGGDAPTVVEPPPAPEVQQPLPVSGDPKSAKPKKKKAGGAGPGGEPEDGGGRGKGGPGSSGDGPSREVTPGPSRVVTPGPSREVTPASQQDTRGRGGPGSSGDGPSRDVTPASQQGGQSGPSSTGDLQSRESTPGPQEGAPKKRGKKKRKQQLEEQPQQLPALGESREEFPGLQASQIPSLQQLEEIIDQFPNLQQPKRDKQQQSGPGSQSGPMQQPGPMQQQPGPMQQQPGPMQQQRGPMQQQRGPMQQQPGQIQQQPGPWQRQPGPRQPQQPDSRQQQQQPGFSQQQQLGPGQPQQPGPRQPQQPGPRQPQQPGPRQPQQPGPRQPQQPGPRQPGPRQPQQPGPRQPQQPGPRQPQQPGPRQPQQPGPRQQHPGPGQQQPGPGQQQHPGPGQQQHPGPGQQQQQQPGPRQQQQPGPRQQQQQPGPEQQHPDPGQQQQQQPGPRQQQQPGPRQQPAQTQQPRQASGAGEPEKMVLNLNIPLKKNLRVGGTRGKKLMVETNHLGLNLNPRYETAVHYDVAITPDKPKNMMRRVWEAFRQKYLPTSAIAFDDAKNAYSPELLPFDGNFSGDVEIVENPEQNRVSTYKVAIQFATYVNLKQLFDYMSMGGTIPVPQDALQCIDIVLRNVASTRFVRVGRSYFSPPSGHIIYLGDGLELWHGFFQSAVLGWKPFINVDVAHKGFPTAQGVINLMAELSTGNPGDVNAIDGRNNVKFEKFLKGLKVSYELPKKPSSRRTYRVNGFGPIPERATFKLTNATTKVESTISVQMYFQRDLNYQIKFPRLPVLWVGPKDRHIYLPAELCNILPGQVSNRKLNEVQTAAMVKNAATATEIRKQKILAPLRAINHNADPVIRAFGISVDEEFTKVPARQLDAPELEYSNSRKVRPFKGTWRVANFLEPSKLLDWTLINLDNRTRPDTLNKFGQDMVKEARNLGLNLNNGIQPFYSMDRWDKSRLRGMFQDANKKGAKIVFVVIPQFPANVYCMVKQEAEIHVGCLTQCIKAFTMNRKMNQMTIVNILLKVNAKLNGSNHKISGGMRPPCLREPCMIMGADVTHPSPDQTDIPSVAAVTASCDANAFKYNFCWRLQPAKQEIISDLQAIVRTQLMSFYTFTHFQPKSIIFFRDGVSEGQFKEVMNVEVTAIRKACASLGNGSYKPTITFVVVQKRHHTRFFPKPGETDDRNNNVRAGTVVDTHIVHPTYMEFYLNSHASIQGTARPTKYRVLWDDRNMSDDELQELTYFLCHMFSRCTRSVSYPAPTYYAHLAAFRCRAYLDGADINLNNLSTEERIRQIQDYILKNHPMFYT